MKQETIAATLRERSSLMDTAEIAGLLQARKETILRYMREGKLPAPIKVGDLIRWDPKTIADFLEADKPDLAKQVAAWLCERVSEGREYAVPPLLQKVLVALPGYEEELKEAHDSARADKQEFLHYLRKRFRYKCEVLLARGELIELVAQLRQSGASNG
jgi:predicted DNA-binding transcriptional regulator AlpA